MQMAKAGAFSVPYANQSRSPEREKMRCAETGINLEIDLSRGNFERVENDPRDSAQPATKNRTGSK